MWSYIEIIMTYKILILAIIELNNIISDNIIILFCVSICIANDANIE